MAATEIVTVRDGASPGERLLAFEQELRIQHPQLTAEHARHLTRQKHADLAQLDHLGLQEPEPETIDPGMLIGAEESARVKDGRAHTPQHARDQTIAAHPDWYDAMLNCRRLPASTTKHQAAEPVRQHADPGMELMRLTEAAMAAEHIDVDAARRMVLRRDPALASAYSEGRPLPTAPVAPPLQKIDSLVRGALDAAAHCLAEADVMLERLDVLLNPAAVATFAAELDPGQISAGGTLKAVPVFRLGRWNGRAYTKADLQSMVDAFRAAHYSPPLKVGHSEAPDVPAVGRVTNLYIQGDVLLADFADVDAEVLAGIRSGKWLSLSCEIMLDHKRDGATYKAALRSIAVLGGHPPGVDLPSLRDALPPLAA